MKLVYSVLHCQDSEDEVDADVCLRLLHRLCMTHKMVIFKQDLSATYNLDSKNQRVKEWLQDVSGSTQVTQNRVE